jgi:hypothetical protein
MPEGATIEIEGLDELIRKLDDLKQLRKVHAGLKGAALHVKGKIAKYPRESKANFPAGPGSSWYERNKGSWYWRVRDNVKKQYGNSEMLGKSWAIKYNQSKFEAIVGNDTSYGPFVQGAEQASFHKRRKWKTVDTVAKEETKRVQEYVFEAVRRAINAA